MGKTAGIERNDQCRRQLLRRIYEIAAELPSRQTGQLPWSPYLPEVRALIKNKKKKKI
jgi:hypothetical protein